MRLCIISHAYLEIGYLPTLALMAAYPGVELTWITPANYRIGKKAFGQLTTDAAGYSVHAIPIYLAGRQGAFLYDATALGKALDACKPDIILHEQEVFALGAAQIAYVAQRRAIPLVMFASENLARSLAWPRRLLMRYVLRRCAAMITVSEQAAERHRIFGFKGPIAAIAQMGPDMNDSAVYGRRGGETFQICYAGRLVAYKGVDCLLRAISELKVRGLKVACTIAGSGAEAEALAAMAQRLGISEETRFTGSLPLPEVAAMLRRSDVLVLPSRRTKVWEEQFGRILTEAMAEGTVTVGSRTGAIPEVIGRDELLFEEDDAGMLAAILERLAVEEEFLRSEQHALWDRAASCFQASVLTSRRIEFLERIWKASSNAPDAAGRA